MPVRTKSLAIVTSSTAGAYVTIYTCPTGYRTIVKDIRLISSAPAPGLMGPAVTRGATSVALSVDNPGVTNRPQIVSDAFIVLDAGDKLEVFVTSTTGGSWRCIASGTELLL